MLILYLLNTVSRMIYISHRNKNSKITNRCIFIVRKQKHEDIYSSNTRASVRLKLYMDYFRFLSYGNFPFRTCNILKYSSLVMLKTFFPLSFLNP